MSLTTSCDLCFFSFFISSSCLFTPGAALQLRPLAGTGVFGRSQERGVNSCRRFGAIQAG
jgi:hypothetical protein